MTTLLLSMTDCRLVTLTTDGTKVKLIPTLVCVMLTKNVVTLFYRFQSFPHFSRNCNFATTDY